MTRDTSTGMIKKNFFYLGWTEDEVKLTASTRATQSYTHKQQRIRELLKDHMPVAFVWKQDRVTLSFTSKYSIPILSTMA